MKTMKWIALVVVAIVVLHNLRAAGDASNKRRDKRAKAAPPPAAVVKTNEVIDGFGATAEKAKERALERALERVQELLTQRLSGTGWKATPEQLEAEFLERFGVVQPSGEPEEAGLEQENVMVAHYKVELTPKYLKEIETTARQQTLEQRHCILARLLGGILTVALVTAGYLRLEESTRGYATKLLRLAVVIVLAVVGAGLWLSM